MPYTATIKDTRTGETVRRRFDDLDWGEGSDFWWRHSNFACDCNRRLEFERAKGRHPHLQDVRCGQGRFSVLSITLDDGTEVYSERTERSP